MQDMQNGRNRNLNGYAPQSDPPVIVPQVVGVEMTKRGYIALMSLLVALGFAVVAIGGIAMGDPAISSIIPAQSGLGVSIVSLVVCIVGFIIQWKGAKIERPGIVLAGYALISITLGIIVGWTLQYYSIGTITAAFIGMIVLAVAFGVLGYIFPSFFEKIRGVLFVVLIALIVVELVLLFLGINQGITDWLVLVVFCGFIGYDFYQAMQVPRTKTNAILFATNIYLDLLNVFVRLLAIFGNDE